MAIMTIITENNTFRDTVDIVRRTTNEVHSSFASFWRKVKAKATRREVETFWEVRKVEDDVLKILDVSEHPLGTEISYEGREWVVVYSRNYREYIAGLKQWVCSATLVEAARAATDLEKIVSTERRRFDPLVLGNVVASELDVRHAWVNGYRRPCKFCGGLGAALGSGYPEDCLPHNLCHDPDIDLYTPTREILIANDETITVKIDGFTKDGYRIEIQNPGWDDYATITVYDNKEEADKDSHLHRERMFSPDPQWYRERALELAIFGWDGSQPDSKRMPLDKNIYNPYSVRGYDVERRYPIVFRQKAFRIVVSPTRQRPLHPDWDGDRCLIEGRERVLELAKDLDEAIEASVRGYSYCEECGGTDFIGWECQGCGNC